jgi:putative ABC transport system ATP-binding protein
MELRAEHICHTFLQGGQRLEVLKEVNLTIQGGYLYALQGRSGSGKTTLMSILCGILAPSGGTVSMGDTVLYSMKDSALSRFRGAHFGIIPQGQSAVSTLTVLENVMLPASISGSCGGAAQRARELLDRMQISDLADVMPGEMSGGEQRRMAVARALMRDPDIIFADEPTSDLDAGNTEAVLQILKEEAKSGKAVFVVSHEARISEYADVMYDIKEGRLLQ